ncbi:MAG: hypothetical protein ACJ70U_07205, partial [Nitrososphaera sp.]
NSVWSAKCHSLCMVNIYNIGTTQAQEFDERGKELTIKPRSMIIALFIFVFVTGAHTTSSNSAIISIIIRFL